jgi:hypothetical protein
VAAPRVVAALMLISAIAVPSAATAQPSPVSIARLIAQTDQVIE